MRPHVPIFALLFAAVLGLSTAASDPALAAPADAQPEVVFADSGADDPERLRAERRAQAHDLDFFAPYYSVEGGRDTTLFLMNTISDPISVTVSALADDGDELALGGYVIESLQHVEISLRERLRGFEEDFARGSLRLSLLGDADTLQGWAVITEPNGQTFEIALITPEEATARDLVAYWDTTIPGIQGAGGVSFHLVNTSDRAIGVELVAGQGSRTNTSVLEISPRGRARVEQVDEVPFGPRGWLAIRHGGEAGDLVAVGLAGRGRHSVSLPLVPGTDAETNDRHESMPSADLHQVQGVDGAIGGVWLTIFNPADEDRLVKIEALDAETGSTVGQAQLRPGSKEVLSVSLPRLIPATRAATDGVRVRVRSEEGGVLIRGFTAQPDGTVTDLAFFSYGVHPNGTYPLPDPTLYETVTTVVNVGYKASRIAGQVYWKGGTYSIDPLEIPAGGTYRFDLHALVGNAPPDLLGRELDPERPGGVLKWTLLGGSDHLIARTEVRPRGQEDRFGFSCFGCCWQYPQAMIVPSEVEFTPGAERPFQISETISDCSGTMGPYPVPDPISLTSPQPFVWNGSTVTSSTAADGDLSFEMERIRISPTCTAFLRRLFGFGRAKMCEKTFNPRGYTNNETCSQQTGSCIECKACCHNFAQMLVCQGKNPGVVESNKQICIGICLNDHVCN